MDVTIPYDWEARDYQLPFFEAMEAGTKRACVVWHRRCGKDLCALNFCAMQLAQRPGIYWHVLPTYSQGKKIIWDGRTKDGREFLDHFPGHANYGEPGSFVTRKRNDEMALYFANGAKYQVIGAEDPDSLVGTNAFGMIFSEFSIYESARIWNLLRPVLLENGGWAVFIFTPRGRNHGHKLLELAQKSPRWFAQVLTVADTGIVSEEDIEAEREEGMPEHEIEQEFYCSFDAPLEGSYYGDLIRVLEKDGQVGSVPWEMNIPVTTFWDLGMRDATCIWFYQFCAGQHRLIDFEFGSDVGLDHYAKIVSEKRYIYKEHLVPPDAQVRELGAPDGRSRMETARKLGLNMRVIPDIGLKDGINAVRILMPKLWIDREKCEKGLEGLKAYVRQKSQHMVDPDGSPVYSDTPKHDWNSHPADALRIGAVGLRSNQSDWGDGSEKLNPDLGIV